MTKRGKTNKKEPTLSKTKNPKRQKLRNNEYYDFQKVQDDLYAKSQNGYIFNIKYNIYSFQNISNFRIVFLWNFLMLRFNIFDSIKHMVYSGEKCVKQMNSFKLCRL